MVAATGIKILAGVDYSRDRASLYVIAVSIGFGMIPLVADKFFQYMPKALAPLLNSGILLASIAAVLLNLYFHGWRSVEEARTEAAASAHKADPG
jgi:NCS2 family nucleobase:cation symporter-2